MKSCGAEPGRAGCARTIVEVTAVDAEPRVTHLRRDIEARRASPASPRARSSPSPLDSRASRSSMASLYRSRAEDVDQLGVRDLRPSSSSEDGDHSGDCWDDHHLFIVQCFASVQKWTGNSGYSRSDSRYSMQWLGDTHTGYDTERSLTQLQ